MAAAATPAGRENALARGILIGVRLLLLFLMLAGIASAQSDQTPRPPRKDGRGLLQVNRDFYDIAAATGGDAYFWAHGEFAASQLQIPIPYEEVLLAYGTVSTKRVFDIPVESRVNTLTVFASVQRKDLAVLVRPDGVVFNDAKALQSYQHMLIAAVDAPPPGIWKLELHGEGLFCVTAHVDPGSGPQLGVVEVKEKSCSVALSAKATDAELHVVAKDGSILSRVPLDASGDGRYSGRCVDPGEPFRLAVRGLDSTGTLFQRVEKPLRDPAR
jgi:hypothetical protein